MYFLSRQTSPVSCQVFLTCCTTRRGMSRSVAMSFEHLWSVYAWWMTRCLRSAEQYLHTGMAGFFWGMVGWKRYPGEKWSMRVKGQRYEMSLMKLAKIDFSKTALFTLFILCAYTTGQRDTEYVSLKAIDIELSELQVNYFSKLILANFFEKNRPCPKFHKGL